ncbi:MAG: hypothetical protein H6673_09600 [Anaerolineales bacterium]|nr:hypothetical protein [Anaerolineales bacterium]
MKKFGLFVLLWLVVACGSSQENAPQLEAGNRSVGTPKSTTTGPTLTPVPTQSPALIAYDEGTTAVVLTSDMTELKTQLEADYLPVVTAEISDRDTALAALTEHNASAVMWIEAEATRTAIHIGTTAPRDRGRFFIPAYEQTTFVIYVPDEVDKLYDFTIGLLYYLNGNYSRALYTFNQLTTVSDVVSYIRGMTYFKDREFAKAVDEYTQAIDLTPTFYAAYCNRALARVQLPQNDDDRTAIFDDLNQAIALDPTEAYAYGLRGQVYIFAGDEQSAITDFMDYQALAGEEADPRVLAAIEELTAPPPSVTPPPIPYQNPNFPDGMVFRLASTMPIMPLKVEPGIFRDVGLCLNTYDITVLQSVEHFTGIWIQAECEGQVGWMREAEIRVQQ